MSRSEASGRRIEHLELALLGLSSLIGTVWFLASLISGVSAGVEANQVEITAVKRLTEETFATVIELREDNAVLKEKVNQLEHRYAPISQTEGEREHEPTIRGNTHYARLSNPPDTGPGRL